MYIKNIDSITHVYEDRPILPGQYYQIQDYEIIYFSNSSTLLKDLANNLARMATDNSGSNDIYDLNEAINLLKGKETPVIPDYAESYFGLIDSFTEDYSTGIVIPSSQVVGIKSIEGVGSEDSWIAIAFAWGTPSEKVFGIIKSSDLLEYDLALDYSRVTGDGVNKLQIVRVNNKDTSTAIGAKFEAVILGS